MELYKLPDRCESLLLTGALVAALALFAVSGRTVSLATHAQLPPSESAQAEQAARIIMPAELPESRAVAERREQQMAGFIAQRYTVGVEHAVQLVRIAERAAQRRGLDPVLLLAMMAVESGFNPRAVSAAGAKGLMQIIPEFHPDKFARPEAVFDPESNVAAGAHILKEYLQQHGDIELALQRYAGASADRGLVYANRIYDEIDRLNAAAARRS